MGAAGRRALVVEDEPDLRTLLDRLLTRSGIEVACEGDGPAGLRRFFSDRPHVVILDVGLPGMDGFDVLERIREVSDVPVLMLTAEGTELQKVRGLRAGANDYVTKPFGRQELLARIEGLLRRAPADPDVADVHDDGVLRIEFLQHRVTAGGIEVALTPQEFRLLAVLARHAGQLLTHDRLLELAWDDPGGGPSNRLKVYVGYLRRKLRDAGVDPIETVRGSGYRYRVS